MQDVDSNHPPRRRGRVKGRATRYKKISLYSALIGLGVKVGEIHAWCPMNHGKNTDSNVRGPFWSRDEYYLLDIYKKAEESYKKAMWKVHPDVAVMGDHNLALELNEMMDKVRRSFKKHGITE